MTEPLIYTSKGNLPLASLRYDPEWRELPSQVQFIERYWLGDELVKENTHIKLLSGVAAEGSAAL